ncbi:MAG: hypothetical protein NZ898_02435 [Myxococcota bacterium]|nr:hypothetical protein [Myxococcota bacterium]
MIVAIGSACEPRIGDACETSVDCSVQGDRICDTASPGGYCTMTPCEEGTCPDDARCVEFRFEPPRLAVSYCMAACEDDADCRRDEGYRCVRASALRGPDGAPLARLLGSPETARFCAVGP